MAQIRAKMTYVPTVEYYCEKCGRTLGRDELRAVKNVSMGKLCLYSWYKGRCPGCKASLTKPEVDDCTVSDMTATMACGTTGGRDAGSC